MNNNTNNSLVKNNELRTEIGRKFLTIYNLLLKRQGKDGYTEDIINNFPFTAAIEYQAIANVYKEIERKKAILNSFSHFFTDKTEMLDIAHLWMKEPNNEHDIAYDMNIVHKLTNPTMRSSLASHALSKFLISCIDMSKLVDDLEIIKILSKDIREYGFYCMADITDLLKRLKGSNPELETLIQLNKDLFIINPYKRILNQYKNPLSMLAPYDDELDYKQIPTVLTNFIDILDKYPNVLELKEYHSLNINEKKNYILSYFYFLELRQTFYDGTFELNTIQKAYVNDGFEGYDPLKQACYRIKSDGTKIMVSALEYAQGYLENSENYILDDLSNEFLSKLDKSNKSLDMEYKIKLCRYLADNKDKYLTMNDYTSFFEDIEKVAKKYKLALGNNEKLNDFNISSVERERIVDEIRFNFLNDADNLKQINQVYETAKKYEVDLYKTLLLSEDLSEHSVNFDNKYKDSEISFINEESIDLLDKLKQNDPIPSYVLNTINKIKEAKFDVLPSINKLINETPKYISREKITNALILIATINRKSSLYEDLSFFNKQKIKKEYKEMLSNKEIIISELLDLNIKLDIFDIIGTKDVKDNNIKECAKLATFVEDELEKYNQKLEDIYNDMFTNSGKIITYLDLRNQNIINDYYNILTSTYLLKIELLQKLQNIYESLDEDIKESINNVLMYNDNFTSLINEIKETNKFIDIIDSDNWTEITTKINNVINNIDKNIILNNKETRTLFVKITELVSELNKISNEYESFNKQYTKLKNLYDEGEDITLNNIIKKY